MTVLLSNIVRLLDHYFPKQLAEKWDNAGLQVGDPKWRIEKGRIALDPLPEVVRSACKNNFDLLITHHPLFFKPMKSIDFSSPEGQIISLASKHQLAIYTAHTNLDSMAGGINDYLSSRIGLIDLRVMNPITSNDYSKIVVFVPEAYQQKILEILFEAGAGHIENYSGCSFRSKGIGTFIPQAGTNPFTGAREKINETGEARIEVFVHNALVAKTVRMIKRHHPYETPAYDVYPLAPVKSNHGPGRIGKIENEMDLKSFAHHVKKVFNLDALKYVGDEKMRIQHVAICSGSGSSLLNDFFSSKADVFITGDIKYHDARKVELSGRALIDIGHFYSEHIILKPLADRLNLFFRDQQIPVYFEPCLLENNPFHDL